MLSGCSLVELRAQPLVEEAAQQQHSADSEERQGALRGAQARQVEEKDLAEADAEENEAADAQQAALLAQAGIERDQRKDAPQRAHSGLAALEVRVYVLRRHALRGLEDRQRRTVDGERARCPDRLHSEVLAPIERPCERHDAGDQERETREPMPRM